MKLNSVPLVTIRLLCHKQALEFRYSNFEKEYRRLIWINIYSFLYTRTKKLLNDGKIKKKLVVLANIDFTEDYV